MECDFEICRLVAASGRNSSRFFLSYSISGKSVLQAMITTGDCGSGLFFSSPFLSQVQPLSTSYPVATA